MNLPIGLSDFGKLRQEGYYFIDKSPLIQEIINSGSEIILIPRPRRFGKTLNLSMVRYFFEYCEAEERMKREKLFKGLAIENTVEFKNHVCKYPVIDITFKDVKERDINTAMSKLKVVIREAFEKHYDYIMGMDAPPKQKRDIETILSEEGGISVFEDSLRILSRLLAGKYGVSPVVLVDEYDTPIHSSYVHGYYAEMTDFMRGLLSGAFKDNPYLYKGVVTGILRVAKESIFSGLNNLGVYTILDRKFSDKFGFTAEEVKEILSTCGLEERFPEVNNWYNGYDFGGTVIFNPWSIINFVDRGETKHYWANTSSNELVKDLIREGSDRVKEDMERLLRDEPIESAINENIVFQELKKSERNIYSLLFFSGYLKCIEQRMEKRRIICKLSIPNEEVKYIYEEIISLWVEESFDSSKLKAMLRGLTEGKIELFSKLLNEFVITTLSFFDTKGKKPEAVYQAFILGILLNLSPDYDVSSNRELGYGRYDVLVLPRDLKKPAIIMELKSIAGFYEKAPDQAIKEAFDQIESKGYVEELKARGYDRIMKLAVVSDGKKVWVSDNVEKGTRQQA